MTQMFRRSSGVLLHVSSLPGPYGIGDLGPGARRWIDWLADAGCRYWQVLPLGPVGFANSPYSSPSSFAGNLALVSPEALQHPDLARSTVPVGQRSGVDYPSVLEWKRDLLAVALNTLTAAKRAEFDDFREREANWLGPHSLFMAIKDAHDGASWVDWDDDLRHREPRALSRVAAGMEDRIEFHDFAQFVFYEQLADVRSYAAAKGVQIIGDVPLYVANDSVDVWQHPELFDVDPSTGEPQRVAGVPPDRFSPVGQVWGTPTYIWAVHAATGFRWWIDRIEAALRQADVLRLDHFTGFCRYYAVDSEHPDPKSGEWLEGPGEELFTAVSARLGDVPIIVEDLGPLGDEVERLRASVGAPGMRVLQEAFEPDAGPTRQPDLYPRDCVVYTGTHDNDTARGRLESEDEGYRQKALAFAGGSEGTFAWDLIERAWESHPVIAVAPMQDLLQLGGQARMNVPGTIEGNWEWRFPGHDLDHELARRLSELNDRVGRLSP